MTGAAQAGKFILAIAGAAWWQMIGLFGGALAFGVVLFALSALTRACFRLTRHPTLDMILTGWIGTPVHELSHALFCLLFNHTITDIRLFEPDADDGSLGRVVHRYNPKSLYQQAGNFFIGAGPIIIGAVILWLLMRWLVPNAGEIGSLLDRAPVLHLTMSHLTRDVVMLLQSALVLVRTIFAASNFSSAGFWVFLYVSLCISSHMGLSPSDLKGMAAGMCVMYLVLMAADGIAAMLHADLNAWLLRAASASAGLMGIFTLATVVSAMNTAAAGVILGLLHLGRPARVRRRG